MPKPYLKIQDLLATLPDPYGSAFERLLAQNPDCFEKARGSSYNHQAWSGGYLDHVQEVMNLAIVFYDALNPCRSLPFPLSDALIVLFVHDLEKPWAYEEVAGKWQRKPGLKQNAHALRLEKLKEVGITLPQDLENAVLFVEGEGQHYNNHTRTMSPLAAFCHLCDVTSARLWYDFPKTQDDPWQEASPCT
jgi:hypothetical protein